MILGLAIYQWVMIYLGGCIAVWTFARLVAKAVIKTIREERTKDGK